MPRGRGGTRAPVATAGHAHLRATDASRGGSARRAGPKGRGCAPHIARARRAPGGRRRHGGELVADPLQPAEVEHPRDRARGATRAGRSTRPKPSATSAPAHARADRSAPQLARAPSCRRSTPASSLLSCSSASCQADADTKDPARGSAAAIHNASSTATWPARRRPDRRDRDPPVSRFDLAARRGRRRRGGRPVPFVGVVSVPPASSPALPGSDSPGAASRMQSPPTSRRRRRRAGRPGLDVAIVSASRQPAA